jgi:hypothetical protein
MKYKVICTIEVEVEAEDHDEALIEGQDLMDWSNANYEVLEEEIK